MNAKDAEFNKRLLQTFKVEAEEHLRLLTSDLLELEKKPGRDAAAPLIEKMFRDVHSLKGAARSVSLSDIEAVCQPLETIFSHLKSGRISAEKNLCDLVHQALDFLNQQAANPEAERTAAGRSRMKDLIRQLKELPETLLTAPEETRPVESEDSGKKVSEPQIAAESHETFCQPGFEEQRSFSGQTVRIAVEKLDPLLLQAEEMVQMKVAMQQRIVEFHDILRVLDTFKLQAAGWREKIGPDADNFRTEMFPMIEENLEELRVKISAVARSSEQDLRAIRRMVDEHLEGMKRVLMLPATTLTESFAKLIRDLAQHQAKEAEIEINGAGIEIDKRILEELKDPLIHLLRNCIDHGIEKPAERLKRQKPSSGKIILAFSANESRQVEITLSDDGSGIDAGFIREIALKKGYVTPEAAREMDSRAILMLIFQSGFTTSPIITDISGRGLGLAIVREKVEKLGGSVAIESNPGSGTTFRMVLPLSLATFRGVLVSTCNTQFVLPTAHVERIIRIRAEDIKTVEGRETIRFDGRALPLVNLNDVLGLAQPARAMFAPHQHEAGPSFMNVVILSAAGSRIAFKVDLVLDELQVLVKNLGRQLNRVRNIAGATILGNGRVVPVINVSDLLFSASHTQAGFKRSGGEERQAAARKILVAEDSITSRTLLKTILENAGFIVTTAVDGMDAFTQARSGEFDLLVSDVDMPRMSGFELTARFRADKKLQETPVILVTALESREDRERGIDAGADAYIVKSSFDQSNLIEVINKLI